MSRVLVVITNTFGPSARDGVEVALAAVAYEHSVSVLLVGAGVEGLSPGQNLAERGLSDLSRGLRALLHHGAEEVTASASCLRARSVAETAVPVRSLESSELLQWMSGFDHVQRF